MLQNCPNYTNKCCVLHPPFPFISSFAPTKLCIFTSTKLRLLLSTCLDCWALSFQTIPNHLRDTAMVPKPLPFAWSSSMAMECFYSYSHALHNKNPSHLFLLRSTWMYLPSSIMSFGNSHLYYSPLTPLLWFSAPLIPI